MDWLSILGDAFWILALAFIGATLRQLCARIGPEVGVPLPGLPKGWRQLRPRRNIAFWIIFGAPLAIGLALSIAGRWYAEAPYAPLVFFCVKTATAGAAVIGYLAWLKGVLRTFLIEGVVKP